MAVVNNYFFFLQNIASFGKKSIETTAKLTSECKSLKKITLLALSIIKQYADGLSHLADHLRHFSNVAGVFSVFDCIKDLTHADDDGNTFPKRRWQSKIALLLSTASAITDVLGFLDLTKLIKLDKKLPVVNLVHDFLSSGFYVFDMWTLVIKIKDCAKRRLQANKELEEIWDPCDKALNKGTFISPPLKEKVLQTIKQEQQKVLDKIKVIEQEMDPLPINSAVKEEAQEIHCKAQAEHSKWNTLAEDVENNNFQSLITFTKRKINNLKIDIRNQKVISDKAIVNIAIDIALLALTIFAIIAVFTPIGASIALTLSIATILTLTTDLASSILDICYKKKELPYLMF